MVWGALGGGLGINAGKEAVKTGTKKVVGLWQNTAKPIARDAAISGGFGGGISMMDGNDPSQVMGDAVQSAVMGAGIGMAGRAAGNKISQMRGKVAEKGSAKQTASNIWNNKKYYGQKLASALGNAAMLAPRHPLVTSGLLLAADGADSLLGDRPSAVKGVWDIAAGGLANGVGRLVNDKWEQEGNAYIDRGVEALAEKSNAWLGTDFATPSKDIEESNKVFEASKKGMLDENGKLPKNLQSRRVKAKDIQNMKSKKELAEHDAKMKQLGQQGLYQQMPEPQVYNLTPEQVATVTGGSDDPGKWRPGENGSGVVKRSDGTYAYVRPYTAEEQAAQDKAYEDHISNQVNQYMLNALSMSQSPFVSPKRAAMYADTALGLRSLMMGAGARNATASAAAAKAAAAQDAQWNNQLVKSVERGVIDHSNKAAKDADNKENAQMEAALITEAQQDPEMFNEIQPGDIKSLYKHEAGKRAEIDANAALKKQFGIQKGLRDVYMGNSGWQNFVNATWPFGVVYPPNPVLNNDSWLGDSPIDLDKLSGPARQMIEAHAIGNTPYYFNPELKKLRN